MERPVQGMIASSPMVFVVDVSDLSVGSPNQRNETDGQSDGRSRRERLDARGEQSQRVYDHDDAVQARNDLFTCTLALTTVRVSVRKEDRITVLGKWPLFAMAEERRVHTRVVSMVSRSYSKGRARPASAGDGYVDGCCGPASTSG